MRSSTGLVIVAAGVMIVVVGLLIWTGWLSWFGRLPGDIRIERGNTRFFMPLTSMFLVSAVVSIVLAIVGRLK
ncbi:MAG TPA: DUF2905 domain-containing protein [Gemmatimonadaceae bacterium]